MKLMQEYIDMCNKYKNLSKVVKELQDENEGLKQKNFELEQKLNDSTCSKEPIKTVDEIETIVEKSDTDDTVDEDKSKKTKRKKKENNSEE